MSPIHAENFSLDRTHFESDTRARRHVEPDGMSALELIQWYFDEFPLSKLLPLHMDRLVELVGWGIEFELTKKAQRLRRLSRRRQQRRQQQLQHGGAVK